MLEIARLLYRSSCLYETGSIRIDTADPSLIVLRYGYVCAIETQFHKSLDPILQIKSLLQMKAAATFTASLEVQAGESLFPFHPALLIRQYVEACWDSLFTFDGREKTQRIQLLIPPHTSCVNQEERSLVDYLTSPRTVEEMASHSFLTSWQLYRFLAFLEQMGALSIEHEPPLLLKEEYQLLGLVPPVSIEQIKTAYRSLIRKFHPDTHPYGSAAESQRLADQLIQIHSAYQRLIKGLQSSH